MRKRLNLTTLELAAVLFVAVLAAAFWATQAVGCGMVAGIGRDVTAMAEGGATKAANDAAAINGKGE